MLLYKNTANENMLHKELQKWVTFNVLKMHMILGCKSHLGHSIWIKVSSQRIKYSKNTFTITII